MTLRANNDIKAVLPPGPALKSLAEKGIFLQTPCGGLGKCLKCKVYVEEGDCFLPDEDEKMHLGPVEAAAGLRLACRLNPRGACRLRIPESSLIDDFETDIISFGGKIADPDTCGLAIDLGTTRITMLSVRLSDGKETALSTAANPQAYYGADTLTRLKAALDGNARGLKESVIQRINHMITGICRSQQTTPERIRTVCLVGNTAMTHLLLEMDVSGLTRAPYVPFSIAAKCLRAAEAGLFCHPEAQLFIPAGIGGFVGSDHVAFIRALSSRKYPKPFLALDIGTNTEMVFSGPEGDALSSLSVPSGPAFEGGHVSCGRNAGKKVVNAVRLGNDGFDLFTAEGGAPLGLCGSALIQVLAEAYRGRIIDRRGKIDPSSPFAESCGREPAVSLWPGRYAEGMPPLILTQSDIDALLMAKAAVRVGIDTLLHRHRADPRDVETVILSGAFGSKLDIGAAFTIGLFPAFSPDSFEFLENAAAYGAAEILLEHQSCSLGDEMDMTRKSVSHVNLAGTAGFKQRFARSFYFPELRESGQQVRGNGKSQSSGQTGPLFGNVNKK